MRTTPFLVLALAALPLAPGAGAYTCLSHSTSLVEPSQECVERAHVGGHAPLCGAGVGAACVYYADVTPGAPVCGDDGAGYACVVTLATAYDALGATCVVLTYGADAPHEGEEAQETCESGAWLFRDDLTLTFRDIPAGGRDVAFEGLLTIGACNGGDFGTTGDAYWWDAGTVHLPGP